MANKNLTTQATPPEVSVRTAAAQALINKVRALREEVPDFTFPEFAGDARALTGAAGVPPAFIERSLVATANSPTLARPNALDPAVSRDMLKFAEAFTPVADEIEALAQFVRHSITSARNVAGSDALLTYALAQRLARHRDSAAEIAPHVADMRRALGRRRGKVKDEQPPSTTTTAQSVS
jgi:hypothetical protein